MSVNDPLQTLGAASAHLIPILGNIVLGIAEKAFGMVLNNGVPMPAPGRTCGKYPKTIFRSLHGLKGFHYGADCFRRVEQIRL